MLKLIVIALCLRAIQSKSGCSCPATCPEVSCEFKELQVRDRCDCCDVCLGLEGSPCGGSLDISCALSENKYGFGCVLDRSSADGAGECHCKHSKKGPFCGQDGVTYKTKCDLHIASWIRMKRNASRSRIDPAYHGECEEMPMLTRTPGKVNNRTGGKAYLACEAYGIPTPHIAFRKVIQQDDSTERYEEMPSDRLNMAVQIRGGPDKHKISAWVLVDPLTADDAGWYECLASNTQGSVSEKGHLEVIN